MAPKPYENSFILEQQITSKAAESSAPDSWAREICGFVDDAGKGRFLKGRSSMDKNSHDSLVYESVRKTAQTDQLRSTVYALRRLGEWLSFRFTPLHGFATPDAFLA